MGERWNMVRAEMVMDALLSNATIFIFRDMGSLSDPTRKLSRTGTADT